MNCCLNQALKPQTRKGAGLRYTYNYPRLYLITGHSSFVTASKILQDPGVRFICTECEGEIPPVGRGNWVVKPKTGT
jgi:hypothetical protein